MSSRGKSRNPNENPGVKPVEKIELHEGGIKKRVVLAIALLAIGLAFLGHSLFSALGQEAGWTQIEPLSPSDQSVASELMFFYELGVSNRSPTAEYKVLTALYTELTAKAYQLFHADHGFDDVHNLHYINSHPGEDIQVEPALYRAFEQIAQSDSRFLFAAPFYTEYKNLFSDTEDGSAALVDPYRNPEIAAYFDLLSDYTASEEHVRLELLDNSTVKLVVSDAYLAFAKENYIDNFIDMYWAKNAFVVDYIVEALLEQGYAYGSISSYDGFMRTWDTRDTAYLTHLYNLYEGTVYEASRLTYKGANSIIFMRAYSTKAQDAIYYRYKNGEYRHAYVDVNDGLCKNSLNNLVSYSYKKGCADVLLSMIPVFIADTFDARAIVQMAERGIHSVYFEGTNMYYTDPATALQDSGIDDIIFLPVLVKS